MTHGDILTQNTAVDVLVPDSRFKRFAGVRGSECRYAFIDFQVAKMGPSHKGVVPSEYLSSEEEMTAARQQDIFEFAEHLGCTLRARTEPVRLTIF